MLTPKQEEAVATFVAWLETNKAGDGPTIVLLTGDRRAGMTFMLGELSKMHEGSVVFDDAEQKTSRDFDRVLRQLPGATYFVGARPPQRASGEWVVNLKNEIESGKIRGAVLPL